MKKYQLIVMSFDGEYKREFHDFATIEAAWEYSNGMGSRWYFFPFHFVTTESGKTIADAPHPFENLIGERVNYIQKIFNSASKRTDTQDMGVDEYAFKVCWA
jgi:hypothetical protein